MHEASLVALAADLLESERRLVAVTSAWRRSSDAWARVRAHPAVVAVGGSLVDDVIAALDRGARATIAAEISEYLDATMSGSSSPNEDSWPGYWEAKRLVLESLDGWR